MTEEVISTISKIPSLIVISRTSAMKYRNTDKDCEGDRTGAGGCENPRGEREKIRNRLRITTQLIDTTTDTTSLVESMTKKSKSGFRRVWQKMSQTP